jgi:hypothetical protein
MANPSRESRKYTSTINLLEDFPGADISQDAVRIVLVADQLQDDLDAKVTGTVDVQEDTPLDVSGAVVDIQEDTPLDVSGATLTVTDDGNLEIADSNGNTIEEPFDVSGAVVNVQEDTSLDVSGATVTVTDDGDLQIRDSNGNVIEEPLDVSGSTVTVTDDGALDINSLPEPLDVSAATVTVTDDGSLAVSSLPEPLDVSGATVNVQEDTALDVSGSTVTVTDDGSLVIDSANQGTLPVEQQTPVGVKDVSGTRVDPVNQSDAGQVQDSTTTAGNNVSLDLGDLRESVGIVADVSGAATLTVSVSTTGNFSGEQHDVVTIDYTSSGVNLEQFDFAYQHIQASVNSNLNELEIVSRGI